MDIHCHMVHFLSYSFTYKLNLTLVCIIVDLFSLSHIHVCLPPLSSSLLR